MPRRTDVRRKVRRGFAAMDPELQRKLSSRGGAEAQRLGRAHQWTADEARRQGKRGGRATARKRQEAA
jgi:general stress protein YciG